LIYRNRGSRSINGRTAWNGAAGFLRATFFVATRQWFREIVAVERLARDGAPDRGLALSKLKDKGRG
jgi:hypothetical protein